VILDPSHVHKFKILQDSFSLYYTILFYTNPPKKDKVFTILAFYQNKYFLGCSLYACFLTWGISKTMGFNTNMVYFWMIWGYRHFRKPPYLTILLTHFTNNPLAIHWSFPESFPASASANARNALVVPPGMSDSRVDGGHSLGISFGYEQPKILRSLFNNSNFHE
jgi:hypothetical protein